MVVGLTWITGFIIPYTGIPDLWYVFIILNSLQGPIIFLSFTWNRKVRHLWRHKIYRSLGLSVEDIKSSSGTRSVSLSTMKNGASSVKQEKLDGDKDDDMQSNNI